MDGFEICDLRFRAIVLPNAPLETLGEGYGWLEGPVWFADHDRVKCAVRVLEFGEQRGCLRAALPRDRPGLVHVEELRDDHPVPRVDEGAGPGELPAAGRFGVLLVLGGHPAVEGELDHGTVPRGSWLPSSFALALSRIRSSAAAAPGVRRGGSSGMTTRTAFPSCLVHRFAWSGPDLGLLSYGRFRELRGAEQAFFAPRELARAAPPAPATER